MIHKIRGTQDFLDLTLFNVILAKTRSFLACNNFKEIATPILEPTELFQRSLGLHTDVIQKQMFTIATTDEQEHICLRPEATASTTRAFLEHAITQVPWKVFLCGPMFRYERPQKGRYRQFHQCSIELIGARSIWYDAYFIALLDRLFKHSFFLEHYTLTMNFLGCPEDRQRFKKLLHEFLTTIEDKLCQTCCQRKETNILRVFDCKNVACQEQYHAAPHIAKNLCAMCQQEWQQLQHALDTLSVSYTYVPTLVRGLDYYDKTVFEFVSGLLGAQNAFCSGGRYDHLVTYLGGKTDYPSLGAALGIERLLLLLEPIADKFSLEHVNIQALMPMSSEYYDLALLIAHTLQAHGICVEVFLDDLSIKSMMRKADKMGAQHVIIIGPEEQEKKQVTIKNMQTGQEQRVAQTELISYFKKI